MNKLVVYFRSPDEFIDHLGTLKQAVEQDQYEIVQHEIRDLKNRMGQCHQDFK